MRVEEVGGVTIVEGDATESLRLLDDQSVNCCVTSPPYWGLRDYGVAGQIGLESTPQEYVEKMVAVFREVRRVLRDDGTLWLNLGDSYARDPKKGGSGPNGKNGYGEGYSEARSQLRGMQRADESGMRTLGIQETRVDTPDENPMPLVLASSLTNKQLIGIPWRVAFALQADGWYLRQDVIWAKTNPMPESVRDRCTKSHEYIFLLAKSEKYYFDADAIKEPATSTYKSSDFIPRSQKDKTDVTQAKTAATGASANGRSDDPITANRNKRDVWTVATNPYKAAHFATFPPDLIDPCVLAGCPVGGVVLDPFGGAGTTGLVAQRHGRQAVLLELNSKYVDLAVDRIRAG